MWMCACILMWVCEYLWFSVWFNCSFRYNYCRFLFKDNEWKESWVFLRVYAFVSGAAIVTSDIKHAISGSPSTICKYNSFYGRWFIVFQILPSVTTSIGSVHVLITKLLGYNFLHLVYVLQRCKMNSIDTSFILPFYTLVFIFLWHFLF